MTRMDKLYEQYEDALFNLLMARVSEEEGKKALEENARLLQDTSEEVPESLYRKGLHVVRRGVASGQYRAARKTAVRFISKVAIVVMVLVLSLTIAFAVSPEIQKKVALWAMEHYADHTEFSIPDGGNTNPNEQVFFDEDGFWVGTKLELSVGYIPEGMELEDDGVNEFAKWLVYQQPEKIVSIEIRYLGNKNLYLDTEDSSMYLVTVRDRAGVMASSELYCSVMVPLTEYEGYLLIECEGISESEVLNIVESITIK